MVNWTESIEIVGPPTEVIEQSSTDQLTNILNQVKENVFEFTSKEPGGQMELATGWQHGDFLVSNAHATVNLLSTDQIIPEAEGEYLAKPLKNGTTYDMTLRIISREHDLAGLLFSEDMGDGLNMRAASPAVGEGAFIVGRTKGTNEKGVMAGKIKQTDENRIYYDIDTKPGSSGSPILDKDGKVIGIHQGLTSEDGPYNGWAIGIKASVASPILREDVDLITEDSGFELAGNTQAYMIGAGIVVLAAMSR